MNLKVIATFEGIKLMLMLPSYLNKAKSRYYTGQPVTPLETYFQPKCKPRVKKKKKFSLR